MPHLIGGLTFARKNEFPVKIDGELISNYLISHYYAFDIETVLVPVSLSKEPQLQDYLGSLNDTEILVQAANPSADGNSSDEIWVQVPVMIAHTIASSLIKYYSDPEPIDLDRVKLFEVDIAPCFSTKNTGKFTSQMLN